jgi:hypothetical protein
MAKEIHDREAFERYLAELGQPIEKEAELPVAEGRPCPVPVRPGYINARAAYRAGCEDEWSDRMKERYGGEW